MQNEGNSNGGEETNHEEDMRDEMGVSPTAGKPGAGERGRQITVRSRLPMVCYTSMRRSMRPRRPPSSWLEKVLISTPVLRTFETTHLSTWTWTWSLLQYNVDTTVRLRWDEKCSP